MKNHHGLVEITVDIVSAFVSKNSVPLQNLPDIIASVYSAVTGLGGQKDKETRNDAAPAVPVKKSVAHAHIICLEDGKRFKSLKRHIATSHGMTPDEYRQKWNLPADYPMTAPGYSEARSALAKAAGLGRQPAVRRKSRAAKKP